MPHKHLSASRSIYVRATVYALVILAAVVSLPPAFTRLTVLAQGEGAPADTGDVQPLAEFVRALSLPANDVIYNPADQTLYASVPSSAGAAGNSIVPVNPATGETGAPVFIGSEPGKMALSDDGHTLYVSLDGSYSVRRFDTATRTPGQQFSLGQHSISGNRTARDIAVAPGNPNLVAIARGYFGSSGAAAGVAVFDNGVQRPNTGADWSNSADFLAFSATESKLYGSGSYSGLQTMTIDASGVTVASERTAGVSGRIKFANGLIYSSAGQVVNPETRTPVGTFSGVSANAFAVDTTAGRAYYLTHNVYSGTTVLKAFDLGTFVSTGSATISGITGEPTTMVRWGTNGLAFRTDAGKLYLLQTSLIPSSNPIPTPTPSVSPTPTPAPVPTFVHQVSLRTNDLVYSAQTQQLYASVPSAAGASGNSIARLNPETGEIGSSLFVGSEPTVLALADDGQTMYVSLNGAGKVRKLDLSAQTAGIPFAIGEDSDGLLVADDIAVMPGSPGTVAVSSGSRRVTIYDEGVPRAQSDNSGGRIEFASPTRLYAGDFNVRKLSVDQNGLTNLGSVNTSSSGQTQFAGGLLYLSSGVVIDPESGLIKGRFSGLDPENVMTIDMANNRAFFLTNRFSSNWNLRAYELDTFRFVGSVAVGSFSSSFDARPASVVRWGRSGLALRTHDRIFLIQTALVDASASIPVATPTPSATPTPTPVNIPTVINKVDLPANDLVIDAATDTLYASVPSSAGSATGNSITSVDPKTGAIGTSTFIGSEPGKLAISDDGQVLYANLEGAQAIRRFDTATRTPGVQFNARELKDMRVVPGSPQSLAVSAAPASGFGSRVAAVFDNGVQRPNTSTGGIFRFEIGSLAFGASPSTLYGHDDSGSPGVVKFELDASGVNHVGVASNLSLGTSESKIEFAAGKLYSSGGSVIDPEAKTLLGRFNHRSSIAAFLVDQTLRRAFFLSDGTSGPGLGITLYAYDLDTFLPLGSVTLPGVLGTPRNSLVRWGTNGIAFCTRPNTFGSTGAKSQIYLIQSALISNTQPIASALQFSASNYVTSERTGGSVAVITVNRTGGVEGTVTVNYATGGGTATPGSDYTTTSGTLSFAPGETTKTFTVAILDDDVYESINDETIGLTLSGQTGNVILGTQATASLAIWDNDSRPSIILSNLAVTEGQSGTTNAQLTVRLSPASYQTVSLNYATADNTANAGSDYVAASGTLTFQPGEFEKTIPLQINGDTAVEPDEQFLINFSNPVNLTFFGASSFVTIKDDDRSFIQFIAPNFTANEGDGHALITVARTGSLAGAFTVNYTTGGGTATPGSDYTTTSGTLSFAPGEATKTFTVSLFDDNVYEGATRETIGLTLSGQSGDVVLGSQKTATLTIQDSKGRPTIAPVSMAVPEGDSGTTNAQFVVRLSHLSVETISVNYATDDGTANVNSDYVAASGTLTFQPGELEKTIPLQIKGDTADEGDERFSINFSNLVNASLTIGSNLVTIVDDDHSFIQFATPSFTASEGDGRATITVTRSGATTAPATVNYLTLDDSRAIRCDDNSASGGAAFARCDYATTFDTLLFAPGETTKTFTIPLVDDGHVEPGEFVNLSLTSALGAPLGAQSSAVLSITDNDAANQANPVDEHAFFVRQHYLDFLSREPDADGLAAWTGVLSRCADAFNNDANSLSAQCDRNIVSSSFFRSAEFELKGYFVYRFYRVTFNRQPSYAEFVTDMRRVTGQTAEEVYAKRRAFTDAWVLRTDFQTVHGERTNAGFADTLLARYGLTAINTNDPANFDGDALVRLTRDELVAALDAQRMTRAQVLRAIVQSREVDAAEYNGAFVAMQYYGYLRRAPEQSGYDAWLEVINRADGYRVMVNGFMNSTEYRLRFGK
ncbi:MAG TPA: Calx-beta domain-containing protein [Pyrinomonadaceae bacterium]